MFANRRRSGRYAAILAVGVAAAAGGSLLSPTGSSHAGPAAASAPPSGATTPPSGATIPPSGATSPLADATAPVSAVDPQLAANLAVFRRSADAGDALPARLQTELPGELNATPAAIGSDAVPDGINTSLSRLAMTTAGGTNVYLVASDGGVCLVASDESETFCAPTATVLQGRAVGTDTCSPELPSDEIEIAGILPDSASDPRLLLSDGQTQALTVQGNVYLQQFPRSSALPTQIEWTTQSGATESLPTPLPPDTATETCLIPAEVERLVAEGKIPRPLGHPPATP
ncbi:MAG: hypothetical protein ABSG64_08555 [Solirubrobacteraceae bacterium]|jgi:hypothetical protein